MVEKFSALKAQGIPFSFTVSVSAGFISSLKTEVVCATIYLEEEKKHPVLLTRQIIILLRNRG